ncbi:MAG: SHOCT domain-containing protein [Nitrosopumilus sp.]
MGLFKKKPKTLGGGGALPTGFSDREVQKPIKNRKESYENIHGDSFNSTNDLDSFSSAEQMRVAEINKQIQQNNADIEKIKKLKKKNQVTYADIHFGMVNSYADLAVLDESDDRLNAISQNYNEVNAELEIEKNRIIELKKRESLLEKISQTPATLPKGFQPVEKPLPVIDDENKNQYFDELEDEKNDNGEIQYLRDDPLEILKKRLAKGEITKEEFLELKSILE